MVIVNEADLRKTYIENRDMMEAIHEEKEEGLGVSVKNNTTNVVSAKKLREIQSKTLYEVKNFLSKTFGPMGSNSKIIKGNNRETISSSYSKDGLKVLKNIANSEPIEASIIEELIDITRHVEHEVGDGTTSTIILSSLIFDGLTQIQIRYNLPPYKLMRIFNECVSIIKDSIMSHKKECTVEDIYDISMISTNGNEEVSENIKNIYKEYGLNVDLSVGISNTTDSMVKSYDGLTITEGMSDPVFINNTEKGTSEIHNAKVYHFADPIDTPTMISYFEAIIEHNIYEPLAEDESPIPTVITCPKISRDTAAFIKKLTTYLYAFDTNNMAANKPPILIITDVLVSDEVIMDDIANLCGCKSIRKYINPDKMKKDQENGNAPTLDNVWEFCGTCELVVADSKKTKFINPLHMRNNDDGELSPIYISMINFLETEIKNTKNDSTSNDRGFLRKRLSALKANSVDYLIGGVTISERDSIKDLVEDAVKNCKSAAEYGVGYAANFEGLRGSFEAIYKIIEEKYDDIYSSILYIILKSYIDISCILYNTVESDINKCLDYVFESVKREAPYDISDGELPNDIRNIGTNVKCSIMLDINVIDTLSKIISMMVTCNQCLLQSPQLNKY